MRRSPFHARVDGVFPDLPESEPLVETPRGVRHPHLQADELAQLRRFTLESEQHVRATAAALLYVACLMTRSLAEIEWGDITESAPAVVVAIAMPLSFSIADGIGLGFISFVLIKLVSGKAQDCSIAVYVIAAIFVLKFLFL